MTNREPQAQADGPWTIAVVGAGPAGLMAAEVLAKGGATVALYDGMASPGRKFLLAGRGGLNLTHSEAFDSFISRYGAAEPYLRPALTAFPPQALMDWSADLSQPTFIGTSGRVFPKSFKTSPLLRVWLKRLGALGVSFFPRHRLQGFGEDRRLFFATPKGAVTQKPDATVLALGGASWPRLGSDGSWTKMMAAAGVGIAPLQPANCGFHIDWSEQFRARFAGTPIKGAAYSCKAQTVRGEATVTREGIEGGAIYTLASMLRADVLATGAADLTLALRPDLSAEDIKARLCKAQDGRKPSLSTLLRKALKLSPVAIGLLYEASLATQEPLRAAPDLLAELIKAVPLRLTGVAPLARAISTAGGILFDEIDENFMLRRMPGVFVAGEMLDWEAPTGGYLLQACFATGAAAGRGALQWVGREPS